MADFGNYFYKVILIGDSGVGKSCLLSRFTYNEFNTESKTTIGVDFATKTIEVYGKAVKAQIWDTAGQERFKTISRVFYNGAQAGMVTYDITSIKSFNNIQTWMKELKENSNTEIVLMLVGNKVDLKHLRAVYKEDAEEYAKENDMMFIETSALDSTNVEQAFHDVIKQAHLNMMSKRKTEQENETEIINLNNSAHDQVDDKSKQCC